MRDLSLQKDYFVRFSFEYKGKTYCITAQRLLPITLPFSNGTLTPTAGNTDSYAHATTSSVIMSSVISSTEYPTVTPGMHEVRTDMIVPTHSPTFVYFSGSSMTPTHSPTSIEVPRSDSSRVTVEVGIILMVVLAIGLSLVVAVTTILMFIRHQRPGETAPGSDSGYIKECSVPNPLKENSDVEKGIMVKKMSRKVWLSFPTQKSSTKRAAQSLAEELHAAGVECLCALVCQTDIATNTYERVDVLMKSTDVILCCCNEDFHSSWMKGYSTGSDSDPDYIFYRECLHISSELRNQQYRRLVIVLLEGSSPCFVPDCLQATPHFRFPCERGLFDLIFRINGSEPNRLANACSPIQMKSNLHHCVTGAEEETEV